MWTQLVWRSELPFGECEQRLSDTPKRTLLLSTASRPFVVARTSGRMFHLFIAGRAMRVMSAPYFHGSLIDKHGGTEIRGRISAAPLAQAALFGCILAPLPIVVSTLGLAQGLRACE